MTIELLQSPLLDGIKHGFAGRRGGVSGGVYASLNVGLGSDDNLEDVRRNRDLATGALMEGGTLITTRQVHSTDIIIVTEPIDETDRSAADGMVTDRPGLILGILTADCVPVLFADRKAGVIGACHAGWAGALGGVTDNLVRAMLSLGAQADRIRCVLGPCIGRASYEVGADFIDRFARVDAANERFFVDSTRPGHSHFDIAAYVANRVAGMGVGGVAVLDEDTYAQPNRFFSYRRTCHLGEQDYGRQISMIVL